MIQTVDIRPSSSPVPAYLEVTTQEELPRASATQRATLAASRPPSSSSLHWDWGPPLPSRCDQWAARPDHFQWSLRAVGASGQDQRGELPLSQTSLETVGLRPDTAYELRVHVADSGGRWDERRGLRLLPQHTLPGAWGVLGHRAQATATVQPTTSSQMIATEKVVPPIEGGPNVLLLVLVGAGVGVLLLLLLLIMLLVRRSKRRQGGGYVKPGSVQDSLMEQMEQKVRPEPDNFYNEIDYSVAVPLAKLASK